jgi:plastocyanin
VSKPAGRPARKAVVTTTERNLMTRRLFLPVVALLAVLVLAAAAFARPAANPTLKGTVGPGFTISLTKDGKKVKTLKPGKYVFKITDKANIHNFVLEKENPKPKFEKDLTDVTQTGTKTYTINLTKGTWKYYCAPHESSMNGTFTVK